MTASRRLIDELAEGRYEWEHAPLKQLLYAMERRLCHLLLRRLPPPPRQPNLLNLGCGSFPFPGWINADDYALRRRIRDPNFSPDWSLDMTKSWRCPDLYWDGIFSEHVIEYCSYSESVLTLSEALRTLKAGAWMRVSLPDLNKFVGFYKEGYDRDAFPEFPHPATAISNLTQMHAHKSTWDADLLMTVMRETGFVDVHEVEFGMGSDPRLIQENANKRHKSFYVEGQRSPADPGAEIPSNRGGLSHKRR